MNGASGKRLLGKVALVTGSSAGIGRQISIRFAGEGADVIINGRNEKAMQETTQIIEKLGGRAVAVRADVSKTKDVEELAKQAYDEFARVDVLVNNAGISGTPYKLIDLPESEWDQVMGTNLRGTWLVSKAICRRMLKQEPKKDSAVLGKVVNISSDAGKVGQPTIGCYSASKAGVIALTQAMARELGPKITVNAICPGYIMTNMYNMDEGMAKAAMLLLSNIHGFGEIPMKRIGLPEDVAGVALFLSSKDSDYVTGQALNVCGGISFG